MQKILEFLASDFLCDFRAEVHLADGRSVALTPTLNENSESPCWHAAADGISLTVSVKAEQGAAVFYTDLVSNTDLAKRGVDFKLNVSCADDALSFYHDCAFWLYRAWPKTTEELPIMTQHFLLRKDMLHYAITGLTGDCFCCQADKDGLYLDSGCSFFREYHGPMFSAAVSSEPIRAMETAYSYAREIGAIAVPLRCERDYPEMFEYFGWCSWDAFYQDVTSEKIYQKLDEFREKKIPVKWVLIDDGWATTDKDSKLLTLTVNPVKFPEGLKECVRRIKEEYGVAYVGVWHTLAGYVNGIHPDSELAKTFADSFMMSNDNRVIPCDDPDRAFVFWDALHSYLADCGIDYVKVDNQSSTPFYLEGVVSSTDGCRNQHAALERSICKHFGGRVINCMGMDMRNVLARPMTAINRNSDDFYPMSENGFARHLQQNVYSAVWHSQIMHCDFDMWWSGTSSPVQSGLLRAVSGGPVYVSDKIGESNAENLYPICGQTGDLCRLDHAALPTLDCIYFDCEENGRIFKTYNHCGDNIVLALFNISRRPITETFSFDVIPGMPCDTEYIAYEYFTKTFSRVNFAEELSLSMGADETLCYSLYPILRDTVDENDPDANAYILLGELDRYTGIASREKKKVFIRDLL
ncbi:MAG: alpha-galactosidase [Clostridia bacterium]|nr:alpha-galactosidase [Clostridia bacterium]